MMYKLKMNKKLAKIKYLPNKFQIIEDGDHVICAVSGKPIKLENLNYWNVDLQEAYFSYEEAFKKKRTVRQEIILTSNDYASKSIVEDYLKSFF